MKTLKSISYLLVILITKKRNEARLIDKQSQQLKLRSHKNFTMKTITSLSFSVLILLCSCNQLGPIEKDEVSI
jgi:hypothetical protein